MLEENIITRIKILLQPHPKGLTITEISSRLKMNRNSVAKYLEVLLISGQVETHSYGNSRIFFLTHRTPISAMLSISSHLVLTLDESNKVLICNDNFLTFFGIARDQIVEHPLTEIDRISDSDIIFSDLFCDILKNPDHTCETTITRQNETYYFRIKGIGTVFDDGSRGLTIVMEDETKERKYQLELELKEARYRGIIEDQTEFICRFLPEGSLTFINDSFANFLKRTPADLLNKCQMPMIYSEDAALWDHACKSIDQEHAITTIECRMPDGTGRRCWTAWTIRGLFDDTGKCREYQAVGRDINEKKETDERIKVHVTQMEFFSRILQDFAELPPDADIYEAIGAGLYEIIPDATIMVNSYDHGSGILTVRSVMGERVRDYAARHFGKDLVGYAIRVDENVPERVLSGKVHHIGKDLYNITFRQLPKEACENIMEALNLGEFYSVGLVWNGVLFGNITFGLQKGAPLTNAPLIEIYGQAASIALQRWIADNKLKESEKKRLEEALKGSENYLQKIFNSTQSGLVVVDPESYTVFDVNYVAADLLGKQKSEIIGSSCKTLFCLAEGDKCPVTDFHRKLARGVHSSDK
ncbi:MAG: PAS domain-containing protein [Methanoregula sp.]|nr:PAS domain-containing protein [Methanoregula sp.]